MPSADEIFTIPPAGFNPSTATSEQLLEYGFPARPTQPSALQTWLEAMKSWKYKPAMNTMMVATSGHGVRNGDLGYDSSNWGGWLLDGSNYGEVSGTFVEPNAGPIGPCDQTLEAESTWAGLGGWNGSSLAQAGTNPYLTPTYYPNVPKGEAWWEFWPTNLEQYLNFAANPFDIVYIDVSTVGIASVDCADIGYTYGFQAYVEDETTGVSNSAVDCTNTAPDLTSAEWIDERPGINCSANPPYNCTTANLADFGQTQWSGAQVFDNHLGQTYGIDSIQALPQGYFIQMVNGADKLTEPGGPGSGDTFTDGFLACG